MRELDSRSRSAANGAQPALRTLRVATGIVLCGAGAALLLARTERAAGLGAARVPQSRGVGLLVSSRGKRAGPSIGTTRATPVTREPPYDPASRTWIEMRNVDLRVATDAVVHVRRLRGEVIPTRPGASALLDSTTSFSIRITSGAVAVASRDLSAILNRFVFGYRGSPLRALRVRTSGTQLVQSGVLHKGVGLRFEITSALSLADSGLIRLHPTKVRVLGINGAALLHALGLRLDDLLDLSGSAAARVRGDDIYLDPARILPPPAIVGRLAGVRIRGDSLVQEFAVLPEDTVFDGYARPDSAATNSVFFRGGRLRFGRLEMRDTDLQILDLDPSDPFDLFLARYNQQLVAGYSRNRPDLSLQAFFPDYTDLGRATAGPSARAARLPAAR